MSNQQQDDCKHLMMKATSILDDVAVSGSYDILFAFWETPSFEDYLRVVLYTPKGFVTDKKSFVSILRWDRVGDLRKIENPVERLRYPKDIEPTMKEKCIDISEEQLDDIVSDLSSISLNPIRPQDKTLGLDGVSYRFKFNQGYYGLDLTWWCDHPESWKGATEKILRVVSQFR